MGSTGSGQFGMYSGGGAGAIIGGNKCPSMIENILLEDVAISEFFLKYDDVPVEGELVELSMQIINKRLVVILSSTQEIIGNMPVSYNYLNLCIKKGKRYSGQVKASGLSPVPYIMVNLYG